MKSAGVAVVLMSAVATAEPASLVERTPWLPRGETELAPRLALPADAFDYSGTPTFDESWLDLDARHSFGSIEAFGGATYAPHIPNLGQAFDGDLRLGARMPVTCMSDVALRTSWALPYYRGVEGYEWADRRRITIEPAWEWKLPLWYVTDGEWARTIALYGDVGLEYAHAHYELLFPNDPSMAIPPPASFNRAQAIATVGAVAQSSTNLAIAIGARVVPFRLARGSDVEVWDIGDFYVSMISAHAAWDFAATMATSNAQHLDPRGPPSFEMSLGAAARF